jgi:hypothetical protein
MEIKSEDYLTQVKNREYKKYEVDSNRCSLYIGDLIDPESIVGLHHETGQPVRSDFNGQIATIFFNPMHDSLMILAVSRSDDYRGSN